MSTSTLIDVESHVNQWNRCEVMDLERHFNFFDKDDAQYKRANFLYLKKASIEQLFASDFVALEIKMGLTTDTPSEEIMSFAPLITWGDTNEDSCSFSFDEKSDELALTGSEQVGNNFLNTLSQNWLNCAPHYFGGLFNARVDNHNGRKVSSVLRLQSFKINSRVNSALFDFLKGLQRTNNTPHGFYFYLGLDYNKFNKAEEYSFSPILSFVMGGEIPHVMHPNFKTYFNAENEQMVNYEYIRPCPPTC